jgi:hypothetical protein
LTPTRTIQLLDKLASHPSILYAMTNIAKTPASTAHTSKTIDIVTMTWRVKPRFLKTLSLQCFLHGKVPAP